MYSAHFNLQDQPFNITPDPAYLYLSPYHREALGHLLYGAGEHGGFVLLTGEVGTGKTTLIRALLAKEMEDIEAALILNPRVTATELIAGICDELGVSYPKQAKTLKPLVDALNEHLLETHAQGKRTVVIIDEAQSLAPEVLEQVRLLTNLETEREKLLRMFLIGQPELRELLARPDMRQLSQRITARYHLEPLDRQQTQEYIYHRLEVAGGRRGLFTRGALKSVYRYSQGVPRLINLICDRALLGAYSGDLDQVDAATVRQAAREVLNDAERREPLSAPRWRLAGGALAVIAIATVMFTFWQDETIERVVGQSTATAAQTPVQAVDTDPPVKIQHPSTQLLTDTASKRLALIGLLDLWNWQQPIPTDDICQALASTELRCLEGSGGWDELTRLNRPAALAIGGETPGYIVLRSVAGDEVQVITAKATLTLPREQLLQVWGGRYTLLWRTTQDAQLIHAGMQGEPVLWLRERLAALDGEDEAFDTGNAVFDNRLLRQVQDFQRRHQLQPDGLVGPRTQIMLNQHASPDTTPRLLSRDG